MSYRTVAEAGLLSLLTCICMACSDPGAPRTAKDAPSSGASALNRKDYVVLVPDWQNDVVHQISLAGGDEGEFLDPARFQAHSLEERLWSSPRGLLFFPDHAGSFWLASVRGMTEWDTSAKYLRTVFADTGRLEVPVCIVRVDDEIFVVSEDKYSMLIFGADGTLARSFQAPEFHRATDCELGPDGLLYVGSRMRSPSMEGLVSIWNPKDTSAEPKPLGYRIAPDTSPDGTISVQSLVFDDDRNLLITEFSRGRVERWDVQQNKKLEVLLDSDQWGKYLELERGPDGLVYLAGSDGLYRFDSRAHAADLKDLAPFFDAHSIAQRFKHEFAPSDLVFVPRSTLTGAQAPG